MVININKCTLNKGVSMYELIVSLTLFAVICTALSMLWFLLGKYLVKKHNIVDTTCTVHTVELTLPTYDDVVAENKLLRAQIQRYKSICNNVSRTIDIVTIV